MLLFVCPWKISNEKYDLLAFKVKPMIYTLFETPHNAIFVTMSERVFVSNSNWFLMILLIVLHCPLHFNVYLKSCYFKSSTSAKES